MNETVNECGRSISCLNRPWTRRYTVLSSFCPLLRIMQVFILKGCMKELSRIWQFFFIFLVGQFSLSIEIGQNDLYIHLIQAETVYGCGKWGAEGSILLQMVCLHGWASKSCLFSSFLQRGGSAHYATHSVVWCGRVPWCSQSGRLG